MNNKVTAAQIAEKAQVSPATVSRVLNHRELVKEFTIQKVEKAMKELGYVLSTSETISVKDQPIIVLNIPGIENTFYQDVIRGVQISAKDHGCYLLIHESPLKRSTMEEFCSLLLRVKASGTIILNKIPEEFLRKINSIVPLVQCCEYNESADFPYVSVNDIQAAEMATEYLLSRGRNKIAIINGPSSFKYSMERQMGFLNAMENAQITVPKQWIVQLPEVNYEMAYAAICRLLNADVRPNAFFTISDIFASAVIRGAKRFSLRVPEDIMVVGFDNIEISMMTTPSITTVNQPKLQMGYTACEILMELMENPQEEVKSILLDTELVIRESA
ncbi:MAG: LacI family DNA-binding transcriptional regulator [Eubacteriales bacterium]|nr:LacI family DNA-binding transcriptional regulator [Eubacteriales bacterium]